MRRSRRDGSALEILEISEPKMNLSDIKEKLNFDEKFDKMHRRLKKNSLLAWYYDMFAEDLYFEDVPKEVVISSYFKEDFWFRRRDDLHIRSSRISQCSKYWSGDYYPLQGVKDLQKVNLCHDRFCDNCQNTLAVQRSDKYSPLLMKLTDDFDIYHVILTVPNVELMHLTSALDRMFKAYKKLCQYLDGRKLIHNVDYSVAGYKGSIRALEITKNPNTNKFHPHFHCLFLCEKGTKICNIRPHVNIYSFRKNNAHIPRGKSASNEPQRFFSDFEILLQKTWRLLYDGIEVNYSNLDELKVGYSCMMSNARGRYKEVFKYATKGLLSSDPNKDPKENYSDFVLLFVALYRRRLIQGYGCLYRLNFEKNIDLSVDDMYLDILKTLHSLETPIAFYENLDEIHKNIQSDKNITYISRKKIAQLGAKDE